MSDPHIVPRLNFGQMVVQFKDAEEHTAYVKHEYMSTWQEYNAYLVTPSSKQRDVLRNKLHKARYDCYLAWKAGRDKGDGR